MTARIRTALVAVPAAILASAVLTLPASATAAVAPAASLTGEINALTVAPESHSDTYDRGAFGDYDRDAILADNAAKFPDCDGYFSRYDDTCYTFAQWGQDGAADHVQIDETVARKEAWESGAWNWNSDKLDRFVSDDRDNLAPMTSGLNSSKGADDVTEWVPPYAASTCHFVQVVADVKTTFDLTVDEAEQQKLLELAAPCDATG